MANELFAILAPAYPCGALKDTCSSMRYDPARGLFPRGYAGATGRLDDVALVLCIAEPGEPSNTADAQPSTVACEVPPLVAESTGAAFRDRPSAFHSNVRFLLECCWPGISFEEKLRRSWITEGVLCSATVTTGRVAVSVERECARRYLAAELRLLSNAFVIALGRKAERRLKLADRVPDAVVMAAGLPGGNSRRAKPSWQTAGAAFQEHLRQRK
jgi:hypothetical protein